jgi:hypothetical protein
LICVLQASVHLDGHHRSVELAAIGRRAAECEEDLLELVYGPSQYQPPEAAPANSPVAPNDRPTAVELLQAVQEHLAKLRSKSEGSTAFHLRVAGNVLAMVEREVVLTSQLTPLLAERLARLDVSSEAQLGEQIRGGELARDPALVASTVREMVRDKLAVSNPGYWQGDAATSPDA